VVTPNVYISGLGIHLPGTVSVASAVERGLYPAEAAERTQLTGVAVAGDVPAPEMAVRAAQTALKRYGRPADDLDLMLYVNTWHQGPDGWPPQAYLQRHLDAGGVTTAEVRNGCNGLFSALELATGYLHGDPAREAAMIVASDNFGTPMMNRWQAGHGYIPGDAASALVLTKEPGFARLMSLRTASVPEAEEVHRSGEPLFPPSITLGRTVNFGERADRFRAKAVRSGAGTGSLLKVQGQTMAVIEQALADAAIALGDVRRVLFLNFSRTMVEERCMAALGLPLSQSVWEYGRSIGHLGASDHVVALEHLLETGAVDPGDNLLLISVGPGIHLAGAVIRVVAPAPWR
jgi:3-oxoacyl-[acyl-carrier-protein] synthase-3